MGRKNQLAQLIERTQKMSDWLKPKALTFALGRAVPFVGTAGAKYLKFTHNEIVVTMKNKKRAQNHIHQVHAIASLLLAESAAVNIVASNLDNDKIPLVKGIEAKYIKRSNGDITAKANLTDAQIKEIQSQEKGEFLIEVSITDADNNVPILCQVMTAWIPKKKK